MSSDDPKAKQIHVTAGYGHNSKVPFVGIEFEEPIAVLQLTSVEARELTLNILQAAETADSDGFIFNFFTRDVGCDQPEAIQLLYRFREYREELGGRAMPAASKRKKQP